MKNVLCYGDSNTWGFDPSWNRLGVAPRFEAHVRWTGLLQRALGDGVRIYEAGHCGRTTAFDDPLSPNCSGLALLPAVLEATRPLDLVVLMLGTNDVKRRTGVTPRDVARGMELLVGCVRAYACGYAAGQAPDILMVAPAPLRPELLEKEWGEFFGPEGIEKSRQLPAYYEATAARLGCAYADAGAFARASSADGLHLDAENHRLLAEGLLPAVRALLA